MDETFYCPTCKRTIIKAGIFIRNNQYYHIISWKNGITWYDKEHPVIRTINREKDNGC